MIATGLQTASRHSRYALIAIATVCLFCIFYFAPTSLYDWPVRMLSRTSTQTSSAPSISTSIDNAPLRELCSNTIWQPDVFIMCDANYGGIGNVHAFVLDCVRTAIHAGAGLIVPKLLTREANNWRNVVFDDESFDYMFDASHFKAMLNASCPEMHVLNDAGDIKGLFRASIPRHTCVTQGPFHHGLWPADCHVITLGDQNATTFQDELYTGLDISPKVGSRALIRLEFYYFTWPVFRFDPPEFVAALGDLLRFPANVYEVAAEVHARLLEHAPAYLALHMRTEKDIPTFWPTQDELRQTYLDGLLQSQLPAVYLASGDTAAIDSFCDLVATKDASIKCFHKGSLLDAKQREKLAELTFDQLALVDYLILLQSSYFMGSSWSSFGHLLALSRRMTIEHSPFPFPRDTLSEIVGGEEDPIFAGIWPVRAGL